MSHSNQKPIVVMAGGTGGHVFPAMAVAEFLCDRGERIVWLGTRNGIESRLIPAAGYSIEWLSVQGLRGKGLVKTIVAPFKLIQASWQAMTILLRLKPKAVLGMGGFVSGPGGLMAAMLRIPLFIHEQNSIIGLTNRLLYRVATRSYFAFPQAMPESENAECIGNPVRSDFCDVPEPQERMKVDKLSPLKVLVLGGSLGAVKLNEQIPAALGLMSDDERPVIKHQCGSKHLDSCTSSYQRSGVDAEIVEFIDDVVDVYQWADLIVCRAGALTVSEIAAVGVASILIPYPHAVDNHQYWNAKSLVEQSAAKVIEEAELTPEKLALMIRFFEQNREAAIAMAVNARAFAKLDATRKLAEGIQQGAKA